MIDDGFGQIGLRAGFVPCGSACSELNWRGKSIFEFYFIQG